MTAATAPDPLVPTDCDLRDFQHMPLDVVRLRDSELTSSETPEACWAAVLLWSASWHQVPASSIPNDELWIAKHAGYMQRGKIAKEWAGVRNGALRRFMQCSDGRLYHPVVAEKALIAWDAKLHQRWRNACAALRKHNERHETKFQADDFVTWKDNGCHMRQGPSVARDIAPLSHGHNGSQHTMSHESSQDKASNRREENRREGREKGLSNTEPIGSGAAGPSPPVELLPAIDERRELWESAKKLLNAAGMTKENAGEFIGKLIKAHTEKRVLQAVRAAIMATPADPKAWLVAHLQERPKSKLDELEQRGNEAVEEAMRRANNA